MNSKRRPSYGVLKLSREFAGRMRAAWQTVETPPRRLRLLAPVIPLQSPDRPPPPPAMRALAA